MAEDATPGKLALAALFQEHAGVAVPVESLRMVVEGASGRCIMRAELPECRGVIGIYWTPDRADNASFLPAAHGLRRAGVRVPAVYAEKDCGAGCGACLVEDLGTVSLLSLRDAPWAERRAAYAAALRTLHSFHRVEPAWALQPAFDASMYRWEQGYFAEHFLQRHLGVDAAAVLAAPAWGELAEWLAALPRVPVHRDFQSQNILMRGGEAWLIDFQGMRMGLPEYDLASLLYDPYVSMPAAERTELLAYWEQLTAEPLRVDVLAACALQRIMQALGAFANIGYNAGNAWYLNLIPAGVRALQQVVASAPPHSPAADLALCLAPIVTPSR